MVGPFTFSSGRPASSRGGRASAGTCVPTTGRTSGRRSTVQFIGSIVACARKGARRSRRLCARFREHLCASRSLRRRRLLLLGRRSHLGDDARCLTFAFGPAWKRAPSAARLLSRPHVLADDRTGVFDLQHLRTPLTRALRASTGSACRRIPRRRHRRTSMFGDARRCELRTTVHLVGGVEPPIDLPMTVKSLAPSA